MVRIASTFNSTVSIDPLSSNIDKASALLIRHFLKFRRMYHFGTQKRTSDERPSVKTAIKYMYKVPSFDLFRGVTSMIWVQRESASCSIFRRFLSPIIGIWRVVFSGARKGSERSGFLTVLVFGGLLEVDS